MQIEDIKLAVLDSFWNDKIDLMPETGQPDWCEIWLRTEDENSFFGVCSSLGIEYKENQVLTFPERKIVIIKADKDDLSKLLTYSSKIAEIRLVKETASFWIQAPPSEQSDWVKNLSDRLNVDENSEIAICVLDTGVNNKHELLKRVINDDACYSADSEWGTHDENGHGRAVFIRVNQISVD